MHGWLVIFAYDNIRVHPCNRISIDIEFMTLEFKMRLLL